MKGDMLGDIVRECHARNIKVIAYTNTSINCEQAIKNPQWLRINKDGQTIYGERTNPFARMMCYNSEEYRKYISDIIKEVTTMYDIDGIFADCINPNPYCLCPECVQEMKDLGLDINDENHCKHFAYKTMLEFVNVIKNAVPEGKHIYLNGIPCDTPEGMIDTHGEIEVLPSGGWGYDHFVPQICYIRNYQDDLIYMTGRFHKGWWDFGGYKGKASIENDCYDALSYGASLSIGDYLHPASNPEKTIYKDVGDIFARLKAYEQWTDNAKFYSEIGVLRDKTYVGLDGARGGIDPTPSQCRISRMLSELKYAYNNINEDMDLEKYSLIILPDEVYMTEQLITKLQTYLKNGGKVISSGKSAVLPDKSGFALKEYDFIEYIGEDKSTDPYYKCPDDDMIRAMYIPGILMKSENSEASYVKAYFDRHWDGLHGYFYTPPEKETEYSAVAIKDNICHICFDIFASYHENAPVFHKNLIKGIIEKMLPNPIIKTDLPSTSRTTITMTDSYKLLHVKVTYPELRGRLSVVEEHNVMPCGKKVWVRGEYKGVYLLPQKIPVKSEYIDGYTEIILPEITGYDMFLLEE